MACGRALAAASPYPPPRSRDQRNAHASHRPVSRNQLLNGWDDVDMTDSYAARIAAFKATARRDLSL